jgi:hypothetical protein
LNFSLKVITFQIGNNNENKDTIQTLNIIQQQQQQQQQQQDYLQGNKKNFIVNINQPHKIIQMTSNNIQNI